MPQDRFVTTHGPPFPELLTSARNALRNPFLPLLKTGSSHGWGLCTSDCHFFKAATKQWDRRALRVLFKKKKKLKSGAADRTARKAKTPVGNIVHKPVWAGARATGVGGGGGGGKERILVHLSSRRPKVTAANRRATRTQGRTKTR